MEITDSLILKKFFNKQGRLNGNFSTEEYLQREFPEILSYLKKRFVDSESLRETFMRIFYKIEKRPLCPICGKKVKWRGKKDKLFGDTCGERKCWLHFREQTMIKRYGTPHLPCTEESVQKIRKTKKERYGDEWYNNLPKRIETNLKKYGSIAAVNDEIIKKRKETAMLHYGVDVPSKSKIVKDKMKKTCLKRYGVDNYRKTDECIQKIFLSKKLNGTVTSSSYEEKGFKWLAETYGEENIIRQYVDTRYKNPQNGHLYHCDFYLKKLDIFIEFQIYWAHGPHPFNKDSKEDQKILSDLKLKAINKSIYNRGIKEWTEIDVTKRETAKKNNLKYIEIFDRKITKDKLLNIIKEYEKNNIQTNF